MSVDDFSFIAHLLCNLDGDAVAHQPAVYDAKTAAEKSLFR